VGERLDENEAGQTQAVVKRQLEGALEGLQVERIASLVVAYEPVWAIGTGRAATPEQANDVIGFIRSVLGSVLGTTAAEQIRIQYGGSVTADNFASIISQPEIDGALVGGASLNAAAFGTIVRQAAE
jgi:triosephosphate isomerase